MPVRGIINTIARGFVGGGQTESTRRKHLQAVQAVMSVSYVLPHRSTLTITITFIDDDFQGVGFNHDDPMVIRVIIANFEVRRVVVDQGS